MLGPVELLVVFPDPRRAARSRTVVHVAHRTHGPCFLLREDYVVGAIGEIDRHIKDSISHDFLDRVHELDVTTNTDGMICAIHKRMLCVSVCKTDCDGFHPSWERLQKLCKKGFAAETVLISYAIPTKKARKVFFIYL